MDSRPVSLLTKDKGVNSFGGGLKQAWHRFLEQPWTPMAGVVTLFAYWVALESIATIIAIWVETISVANLGVHLLYFYLVSMPELGLLRVSLMMVRGETVAYHHLFGDWRSTTAFFLGKMLFAAGVLVLGALLILPGLYFAARTGFFGFFAAEGEAQITSAYRRSLALTGPLRAKLFLWTAGLAFFNLAGLAFLGIGFLLTFPVTLLFWAAVYDNLNKNNL